MMSYKYTDATNTVVHIIDEDGISRRSMLAEFAPEGATPLPADPLPPPQPKQFTSLEYLDLFTESEQLAVVSATMAVPQVKLWYDKMLAAGFITSADPRTEGGLSALVGAGLLTEARKVEILGVMA